ncbi:unhealthy ribosome biogenesis protein 2 homolog [Strongylocentrotus purpuratus]|uniref:Nucleolar 27S pre-rRNA processing Urb2/Npa2 C-terminal domain-containing protein n=1 Tax=Strongylocentrotus purpuratus TaxID=7668 RepID=A0A7M7NVB2_STRPU|nr:unhealthy ribosome biogenesis protein 2 homolog [Strongylocentrotus purpuratus]
MAAYYAGLHKRLKDNSVPIADRVKLARFGWVSNHCFLPNKHQVLLDWVSFRLVNSEKDGTSDADEQSLWLFLHDALKSQEMASIQREGKPICLRGNLCSALLSTLLKDDVSDIVIGCCDMILTNEKLRFVQNTKFESLIAMTVALVEMASKHLEENVCLDEHGQILRVMGKALAKSSNFLQQQQNGKKAYGLTSEQLILPCLRLYSILSSCRHGNSELCVAGLNALNNSFRSLLFSRNMAEAYKMYLMSEEGDKQKKDGRVRADVVDKFMDFLQSKSGEASTICGFPVIYSAFLTSFKPSPDLTFAMLQKMCSLMDFKTDGQPSGSFDDASWDRKLCTMEALLKLATSHKCYAVVEEETERTKKMEWFKEIVSHLMANKRLHPSWYGCLDIIFSLDHNILATRMQEVWPCLLATNASMAATMQEHDDADDARVGESRDAFLKSVMETYTKLRQIDRLTKVLLSSILTKKEFSSSIQLPASFLTSFGAAVESLTPGSTVALWDIIMSDITTNHLPAIMHHASQSSVDPPPAKKKRKVNKQVAGENGDAVARFEASATVLHTFLMNSKMADAAEVGQVKGQVLKLFDMMADDVLKPLLGIFSHENQSLAFSTLLLCYGWGELHLMLRQHTNLMERVPLPTLNTPMKNGDVHYLHTYSHASDWLRVMSPSVADGNEKLCFLKHQLLWQQARGLVLLANLEESSVKESLTSCISQALELSVERSESNSGRWDGLIGHATQSNIYTALLTSLLSQSLTLFTFMDESMHSSVAGLVCQAVCGSMHSEDNTNECSACTVRNAALGFLDSEACRESRPMQNAVVNAVADQLKELNKSLEAANLSNSKKDGKKDTHSKGKKQSREIQHSKGNQMLSGEDNFKTGVNLLEVLKHLPLLHLSASNRVNCMLGLVSLDTKTVTCVETMSPAERQKSCDLVELSTEVRRLLTAILKGVQQGDEVLRNEELNTWFFSFLSELGNLLSQENSRLATTPEYKEVSKGLISLWLKKATWSGDSVLMFSKYLKSFHQHIVRCLQKLKSSKKPASLPGVSTVLSIVVTLLNQIALACRHKTADAESKELLGLTCEVSSSVFQLLGQILASTSRQDSNHQLTDVLRSARTLLLSFESTQKLNRRGKEEEDNKDKEETDKSSSRDGCGPNTSYSPHFTTCYQRALSIFSADLKTDDDSDDALVGSSMEYLESHCSIIRDPLESRAVWSQLHTSLAKVSSKCHSSIKKQLEDLLIITLGVMETDDLNAELQQMLTSMTLGDESANMIGVLQAWQLLPSAMLSNESYIIVMEMLPQVLKKCQKLLHGTVQMQPLEGPLIVAILTTVAKFVSQGKDLLSAEHAIPTMHLCLMVPWDDIPASHFPSCFAAAFRILNDLMMCYSGPVLKAVSAYISCVNRLLSALVERCSQQTTETMKVTDQQLITCAENMQRLLSLIASLKGDISQYGIYLIADYISGLQKTTLPSQVKTPLVGGVYKIVDVCDEKTLSLLNVTLPVSLKEIFRSFYVDYKKHHKYTGHV